LSFIESPENIVAMMRFAYYFTGEYPKMDEAAQKSLGDFKAQPHNSRS
jgi:hypothetical protein